MILKSTQEKLEFLEGCLSHIDHLFKYVSNKVPHITLYKKKHRSKSIFLNRKLPSAITIMSILFPKSNRLAWD